MIKFNYKILITLIGLLIAGCSMTRMAANQTTSILVRAMPAYERETNLEFAEQAIVSNLKLLEGLLEVTPDKAELLLLASRSYTLYAFGFVEQKIEIADKQNNIAEKDKLISQAVDFYERGRKYSLKLLSQSHKTFAMVLEQDLEILSIELKSFKKKQVPALFWTAYAWGNIINLQQTEPARLAQLPKVELIMRRVLELDENYFFGGAHLFYGAYYGSRPKMLGGDAEKAKKHLQRAIEISNGKYLMAKVLFAKYYAVPAQDRELFESTLQEIISAPPDLFPEQGLANQIAKRDAKRWLGYADELFL